MHHASKKTAATFVRRSPPVRAFPNTRPPTKAERDVETLRDLNAAAQLLSDGVGTFAIIFCGLNWISYRRKQRSEAKKKGKNDE